MRFTTLPLALALVLPATAQVTIGQNEMPHAGDDLLRTRAANLTANYAPTGPNFTWNFANLNSAAQETRSYQTVSSTNPVYALLYIDLFFNPNRANHATDGVDIPFNQLLPISNPYTFYYHSSTQYRKVGYGAEISGLPVPITFAQQDVVYELPLNFGDQSVSNSAYQLNVPNLAYYGYAQTRTNDVDGWGSITTPAGTFDVLRVHTILAGRDSINLDTLSLGFAIDRPVVHEYKWLAPGLRVPVLQINTTELFGTQVVTEIWFYDEPRSVDVVQPLPTVLCAGVPYTLTYDENGSYNPGSFLIPANTFTAQLSDAAGDFTNAVNIGSVNATQSGTISITIPANTPPGTGYRIRVNASSPATTGNDNGLDITIQPGSLPVATASAGGNTTFCDGDSVLLSAAIDPAYTYQWLVDGSAVGGATAADLQAGTGGTYTVVVTNVCGNDTSAGIDVTVDPLPTHTLDQVAYAACDGASATLTAIDQSGIGNLGYQWTLDGNAIPGADQPTLSASTAGDYAVVVTAQLTGCSFTTASAPLTLEPTPVVSATAQGPTSFCDGGSVVLDAGNDPGLSYQWFLNGDTLSGATAGTLTADSTGTYTVVATSTAGCTSAPSAGVDVTENPIPTAPVITQGSDTLYASGTGDFQWYLFGSPLAGSTDSFIETATSGDYTVMVTDSNGCSATSDPYTYIATGIATAQAVVFNVYPNPGDGLFTVSLPGSTFAGDRYQVLDVTGQVVMQGRPGDRLTVLDLTDRAPGVYFLQLVHGGATHVERLVKR
ncbi:MAG: T9SS type A sorting domain-containing protein [Flavobacteriales bacterium]|nr:T9SS type A sorting domain-containing protein [Flavobacteriales bacterium]